ncbi:PPP4R2-domain-containing protein [Ganoderma leucocontextum]|nr:PPP4R2-domain-containing protein [Ganoderma leucocontextum]
MDTDPFEWKEDYGDILEKIAATDIVQIEWPLLRNVIKYRLDKNLATFLADGPQWEPRPPLMITTPQQLQNGGLKLPPFPAREYPAGTSNPLPKVDLSEKEADEFKTSIHAQLDEFDGTPFTIQRICELCVNPRQHYKYIGKYLRAVEKTLLVTSTWDVFPPLSESDSTYSAVGSISTSTVSAPNTPLFSPIPFLHEDARRSKSRSPPPSPLILPATIIGSVSAEGGEGKALGLVDELDDPSPGHMSDHIEPISATTTVESRPLHGTLEERFVKGSEEGATGGAGETSEDVPMAQDEEGKENKAN